MTYRCGICGSHDITAYLLCEHAACPDGRDQREAISDYRGHPYGEDYREDAARLRAPRLPLGRRKRQRLTLETLPLITLMMFGMLMFIIGYMMGGKLS